MHKRLLGTLKRKDSTSSEKSLPNGDSPEATAARGVRLFCESGGPNNTGDEVLHLPTIVEAAESSPAAASQAAVEIRKYLSTRNYARAYVQYNAIMLVRILADNPGPSFTKNVDSKFVSTAKELLREGRDISVQQILRETLEFFENNKSDDDGLGGLRDMWRKEKNKYGKRSSVAQPNYAPPPNPHFQQQQQQQQNYFSRQHRSSGLPAPAELSQRVEEARTSAKLLTQLTQTTPIDQVLSNELLKEFAERCASASRSMQKYINSDNPPPDEDTLLTLIETNDALATAMSRHQRSVLQARRVTSPPPREYDFGSEDRRPSGGGGIFTGPPPSLPQSQPQRETSPQQNPPQPQAYSIFNRASDNLRTMQPQHQSSTGSAHDAPIPAPHTNGSTNEKPTDPFADPPPQSRGLQQPLVPQNYGLPPDNIPVPGSPKGESMPFGNAGGASMSKADDESNTGGWTNMPINQAATVAPRGEPPQLISAPKPRYRF